MLYNYYRKKERKRKINRMKKQLLLKRLYNILSYNNKLAYETIRRLNSEDYIDIAIKIANATDKELDNISKEILEIERKKGLVRWRNKYY